MRDDKPGGLGIRLGFGRVYGNGPDRGRIKPRLEISDGTSGHILSIDLTSEELTEMLAGGEARVSAAAVTGFKAVREWGKYHHMQQRTVKTADGDYLFKGDPRTLPHLAAVIGELEAQGYRCDAPRRNNSSRWVIIGRKYTDEPQP